VVNGTVARGGAFLPELAQADAIKESELFLAKHDTSLFKINTEIKEVFNVN
jgi:hypothetical protein